MVYLLKYLFNTIGCYNQCIDHQLVRTIFSEQLLIVISGSLTTWNLIRSRMTKEIYRIQNQFCF